MKTPMQELIEQLNELEAKLTSLDDAMYRGGVRNAKRLAEELLKKERKPSATPLVMHDTEQLNQDGLLKNTLKKYLKPNKMSKNNLFVTIVTALLVTLKLTSVIDWSWLWVFSPAPISFVIGFIKGFVKSIKKHAK